MNNIQLAHGSGGQAMQQLINSLFMEAFANPWLAEQEDQARLELAQLVAEGDRLAFSTDSYQHGRNRARGRHCHRHWRY